MKYNDLPERWKTLLRRWIQERSGEQRDKLCAADFSSMSRVKIVFEDESEAQFRYAFFITAPELNEVGVFTEHCGYHIFPLCGTGIALLE